MTKLIKKFIRNEDGAAAAEYALILAVIGGGVAAAALALGGQVQRVIAQAVTVLTSVNIT